MPVLEMTPCPAAISDMLFLFCLLAVAAACAPNTANAGINATQIAQSIEVYYATHAVGVRVCGVRFVNLSSDPDPTDGEALYHPTDLATTANNAVRAMVRSSSYCGQMVWARGDFFPLRANEPWSSLSLWCYQIIGMGAVDYEADQSTSSNSWGLFGIALSLVLLRLATAVAGMANQADALSVIFPPDSKGSSSSSTAKSALRGGR
jgi:hypothetical protein